VLLSFLDLDMAFFSQSFVNFSAGTLGLSDAEWTALKEREFLNLQEVLCGVDASNGVPRVARPICDSQPRSVQLVKSLLYDTLVHGLHSGYHNRGTGESNPNTHVAAQLLMRLAIIVMADYVA
jgi:hypothetical protein